MSCWYSKSLAQFFMVHESSANTGVSWICLGPFVTKVFFDFLLASIYEGVWTFWKANRIYLTFSISVLLN